MCSIVDANVVHEVFGTDRPEAGVKFFEWFYTGSGHLVVGGKLLEELKGGSPGFRNVVQQLQLAGRMTIENKSVVDERTEQLQREGACKSNDPHVIALAQISGARLLYSADGDLQQDFNNKELIDRPRGKIYPARGDGSYRDGSFQDTHNSLLKRRDLCSL